MLLRFPLEPLLSLCAPDVRRTAHDIDRRVPHRLVLSGSDWADAGLGIQIIPSLPWPLDLRAWRQQQLSEDIPDGLILAPLHEESLHTQAGWPVTIVLAAVCHDPARVESYRHERLAYFFTLLDTVAAVLLYVRDRAAYQRLLPGLTQALQAADVDWEPPESAPATLSQLWAAPPPSGSDAAPG